MISRKNRFHGRNSVRRLQSTGKSVRSGAFSVRFAPRSNQSAFRLAVVVSRKVSKSAVIRNRIRRRLYERVRILSNSTPLPFDLVIVVYDVRVGLMEGAELDAELAKLFATAKLTSTNTGSHGIVKPKEQ